MCRVARTRGPGLHAKNEFTPHFLRCRREPWGLRSWRLAVGVAGVLVEEVGAPADARQDVPWRLVAKERNAREADHEVDEQAARDTPEEG